MNTTGPNDRDVNDILRDMSNSQPDFPSHSDGSSELVRTSEIAVASAVCAFASLACFVILLFAGSITGEPCLSVMMALTFLILPGAALILGLIGLASIGFSGGRRTGYAFAVAGISLPLAGVLILFLTVVPRIRTLAHRMECSTNLSGIGKAMLLYANDNDDLFPRAGGRRGAWAARTPSWAAEDRQQAYGLSDPNAEDGRAGISASLYLLIKYAEVTPKIFVCTGDKGTTVFEPTTYGVDANMVDLWDFGPDSPEHCSYAYQMVYAPFELRAFDDPNFATVGDRNLWMDSPSAKAKDFSRFLPDIVPCDSESKQAHLGNTVAHKHEGQNVMFLDTHVEFEKRPFCGLDNDNIYTSWNGEDKARGVPPRLGSVPADAKDSLLVNDPIAGAK